MIDTNLWTPDNFNYNLTVDNNYLYVLGEYHYVGPHTGCAVKITKTSNEIDKNYPLIEGRVNCIIPDGNGGWYIAGGFSKVGNQKRNNLAHIFKNGDIDPNWDPNASWEVKCIVKDSNYFFIGGNFINIDGQTIKYLAKLDINGKIDKNFNSTIINQYNNAISTISVSESNLYISGNFSEIAGKKISGVAKLNKYNGDLDTNWIVTFNGINHNYDINAIKVINKDIYIGGRFDTVNGLYRSGLVKVNDSNGSVDLTWNPNLEAFDNFSYVSSLEMNNNYLYVIGRFNNIGGLNSSSVARFSLFDGKIDTVWKPDTNCTALKIIFDSNDIFGLFSFEKSLNYNGEKLVKLNSLNGQFESFLEINSDKYSSYGLSSSIQGDDIYIGGSFFSFGGQPRLGIARINKSDGSLDTLWNPDPDKYIGKIAICGNDIYVLGQFGKIRDQQISKSAKIDNIIGDADPNWDLMLKFNNSTGYISEIVQDGDYLYFGGHFNSIRGQSKNSLARLNLKNGIIDPVWSPDVSNNDTSYSAYKFIIDSTDIYVEGNYYTYDGNYKKNHIKLSKINKISGQQDKSWDAKIVDNGSYSRIYKSKIYKDYLYLIGNYQKIGDQENIGLMRINKINGIVDTSFNKINKYRSGSSSTFDIHDNFLYLNDYYDNKSDETRILKINLEDLKLDNSWVTITDSVVYDICVSDSNVYIGGLFEHINNVFSRNLAKVNIYQTPSNLSLPADTVSYGKKRVHLERYDTCECYTYKRFEDRLYFVNKSYSPIVLNSMKITQDINGDAFEIYNGKDYIPLKNYIGKLDELYDGNGNAIKTISTMTAAYLPVFFHPKTSGEHKLSLEIDGNFVNKPVFVLSGTGVYPKVTYSDTVDFGTVKNGINNITNEKIKFVNQDWEYSDTLKISEFLTIPAKEISNISGKFEPKGFYYGSNDIKKNGNIYVSLPVKLAPKDSIEIKIQFAGLKPGESLVNFSARSDAETEVLTVLKGFVSDDGSVDFSENEFDFKVFNNEIHFSLQSDKYLEISLYNLLGVNILKLANSYFPLGENTITLPVDELNQGIYFLEIKGQNSIKYVKFSIVK